MPKTKIKYIDPSAKSIALGIVIGITTTAVIVSSQAFIGLNEFNRSYRHTVDKIKSIFSAPQTEDSKDADSDFSYPHTDAVKAVDVSEWEVYTNEEFGFTLPYPSDWNLEVIGSRDCSKNGVDDDCFAAILTDKDEKTKRAIMVSTSDEMKLTENLETFPTVMLLNGNQKIFSQYRKSICTLNALGVESCKPDPNGFLQFTNTSINMSNSKLEIYVLGNPGLEQAAILNNLNF